MSKSVRRNQSARARRQCRGGAACAHQVRACAAAIYRLHRLLVNPITAVVKARPNAASTQPHGKGES
jgi:hypothetical protein